MCVHTQRDRERGGVIPVTTTLREGTEGGGPKDTLVEEEEEEENRVKWNRVKWKREESSDLDRDSTAMAFGNPKKEGESLSRSSA